MVRRWSHINNINNLAYSNKPFFFFKKKYKLVNFKTTVSLKRFNKKYTKFKRKAFNRIKHIRNWFIYHNSFKFWSYDYLFVKHYFKFQYLNNIFVKNYLFYNFNFLKNFNPNIYYNWNFLFFNLTKKSYTYFNSPSILKLKSNSIVINCLNSFAWFNDAPALDPLIVPFYYHSVNNLYSSVFNFKKQKFNVNEIFSNINFLINKKITLYYQIFILLLFIN